MPHDHHAMMNHSMMDHSSMDHSSMDHSSMDHSSMDHSSMDHSSMDHSMMDHSGHHGHGSSSDLASVLAANVSAAVIEGVTNLSNSLLNNGSADIDHSGHLGHSGHAISHIGHATTHSGGMKMYFHLGVDEVILFKGWETSTVGGMIGSMIGIFIIALFYEGLKYFREYLFKRCIASSQYAATCTKGPSSPDKPVQYFDQVLLPTPLHILSPGHFLQTFLHMFQFIISYCLMLIFMTYNVWLCLACTLGAGIGYFLFGWKKTVVVDVTEHCH